MQSLAYYQDLAVLSLTLMTIFAMLVGAYGWVSGKLPFWVGRVIKWRDDEGDEVSLPDLARTVDDTRRMTTRLEAQHREVVEDLNDVKATQVDIAIAVNNDDMVIPIDKLRRRNFGGNGHAHTGDLVEKKGSKGFD